MMCETGGFVVIVGGAAFPALRGKGTLKKRLLASKESTSTLLPTIRNRDRRIFRSLLSKPAARACSGSTQLIVASAGFMRLRDSHV